MQLDWSLYNNPVTENNNLFLDLSARYGDSFRTARLSTLLDAGFGPAEITIENPPRALVLEAANHWLTKRVRVTDGAGNPAWEGFVAEVDGSDGYLSYNPRIGGLVNRVRVIWRKASRSGKGQQVLRVTVNDTASQSRYGIFYRRVDIQSHGVIGTGQATRYGQTYLNFQKMRRRPRRMSSKQANLTLTLWGYKSTLTFQETFLRKRKAKDLGAHAIAILQSGVCQYLDTTDTSRIQTMGVTVRYMAQGDWRTPDEMLADLAAYGDSNYNMIFAQVWEDRKLTFAARPTTVGTIVRGDDPRVWDGGHTLTQPWMVRAGDYMLAEDLPAPLEPASDIDNDERAVLLRSTDYDDVTGEWSAEPYDLEERDLAQLLGYIQRRRKNRND